MSETASFVDPVFLSHFGLGRVNVIDYFLHPLNPFRTKATTSNEELAMQRLSIGTLMQYGSGAKPGPLSLKEAEEEYAACLSKLTGEQYELMSPPPFVPDPTNSLNQNQAIPAGMTEEEMAIMQSPLFTLRHVFRSNRNTIKVLGIYYVMEGVIYKSPSVRSLMKSNVTRTLEGLTEACDALSECARYEPSTGYQWKFNDDDDDDDNDDTDNEDDINGKDDSTTTTKIKIKSSHANRTKRRRILDNRRPGERTDEEEEGIRASEAIDRILVRLSKQFLKK